MFMPSLVAARFTVFFQFGTEGVRCICDGGKGVGESTSLSASQIDQPPESTASVMIWFIKHSSSDCRTKLCDWRDVRLLLNQNLIWPTNHEDAFIQPDDTKF